MGQGLLKVYCCSTPNGVEQVKECEGNRAPYDKASWFCLIHNQLEEREEASK